MSKREKRDTIDLSDQEMLKPLDITKFGSDKDPCFGKLYNLNASECKRCGDSEICGTKFSQTKLNSDRESTESKDRYKDLELGPSVADMETYIASLRLKGYKDGKVIRLTKKKFNTDRDTIKALL